MSYPDLQALPDSELLAQLRQLPNGTAGHEAICEILVTRYAALVQSCVRPYRNSPEPAEDLLQVGYLGLLKAINNFDPHYGDSLGAYAAPTISGESQTALPRPALADRESAATTRNCSWRCAPPKRP